MRRWCALGLVAMSGVALTQEKSREYTSYVYDANGNRVAAETAKDIRADSRRSRTERIQTINGGSAPLEQVDESVVSESAEGKAIERTIRRFDQNGHPLPVEIIRIKERKTSAGTTSTSTVYRADLNGRLTLTERATTESTKTGDVVKSTTVVERPSANGSVETVERREGIETAREGASSRDAVTWRRDASGRFYEAARETAEAARQGNRWIETVTQYNAAVSGTLEFAGRNVTETEKDAAGSERRVVNVYGPAPTGRAASQADGQAFLKEQQIIETRKRPDGSTVEVFGIRRPSVSDSRLGEYQRISEIVCRGDCGNGAAEEKR
ncbi:MAG: hypothetical protein KIT09_11355 [Bryobacteraceae bacterium]|nr:hypothetical protein [Bryobacteraceae bacterium]